METLYIRLHPTDNDLVELRYWREGEFKGNYKEQTLDLNEIQQLLDDSERDYYVLRPNLKDMGQVLFQWLDGSGRWLDGVLRTCPPQGLVLAIDASERLANLPWEVLHDGNGFLVDRFVVPVRWVDETPGTLSVRESGLQVLFMATSPEGVKPVLDFEREEAQILDITKNLPLQLRVEESGCVKLLGTFWRRFAAETFDIFHLTGHGDIHNGQPIFVTESDTGERLDVGVSDLVGAFQRRFPRLAFLSGCRTGQGDGAGTFPSMAEAMVREGVPAVLGWGRPIGDRVATDAAGNLYERLAEGDSIAAAVG
ncbi:MAG: CHAT domain-containing protein, partial [Cyanobacteria bacterium J06642_2]